MTKVLIAIPSASPHLRRKIVGKVRAYNLEVLSIPGSADLVSGRINVSHLKTIKIEDILGREPVAPNTTLMSICIENKTVMVTGAGGSIGSELCRQILTQNPEKLILLEASELALYSIEKELKSAVENQDKPIEIVPILNSVLNYEYMERIVKSYRVFTIYHAAAYKHVPLVEKNVEAGLRNNVWGTLSIARAALKCNVRNFVLISTDKAVRPTNVMGTSKRLAELILQAFAAEQKSTDGQYTRFSMVRFGNVLGSSGSVVPLFKEQIANGGPLTITHKDITRYFMTIPEAAQLVIQAGSMGTGGEVYVLDMGDPIKIDDLAKNMIHLAGLSIAEEGGDSGDIQIKYTGLRPGEKLYEELLIGDNVEGTKHQRIMKARELSLTMEELNTLLSQLDELLKERDIEKVNQMLKEAPLGYAPSSNLTDSLYLASSLNDAEKKKTFKIV